MLAVPVFYFSLIRKYVAAFGTVFNEIRVPRYEADGNLAELIKVPLTYAPKEKVLQRLQSDSGIDRKAAVVLPRMSFALSGFSPDPTRRLTGTGQVQRRKETGEYVQQFNPEPVNFGFVLWIYAKNVEDALKIVEQIVPFFKPDFTIAAELIPEMGITVNLPIVMGQPQLTDTYDGSFTERRHIVWEIPFTLKGYLYGPVTEAKVIKFSNATFYVPSTNTIAEGVGNTPGIDRVTVQPGMLANGSPTTNAAASVPYTDIEIDDDWGFAQVIYGNLSESEGTGGADEPVED